MKTPSSNYFKYISIKTDFLRKRIKGAANSTIFLQPHLEFETLSFPLYENLPHDHQLELQLKFVDSQIFCCF